MEEINQLSQINLSSFLLSSFAVFAAFIAIADLIGRLSELIGKPVSWVRRRAEDHELLIQTSQSLIKLKRQQQKDREKSDRHDEEMRDDLKKLTELFIDKEINDMRWEINNFATKVSEGKPCNKDSYQHCIHTYEKYEKLLEENGLENGEVEISMEIVNESYRQKLKKGF